jgi:hypothetical protein
LPNTPNNKVRLITKKYIFVDIFNFYIVYSECRFM